ncbi:MAG: 3-octaprenyl-4-hydroxybenzoate carboxy-lyase [Candidatus Lambdaproteobacteria bacterium RIFOXYD1_FULL_56_27]|uniref:Flavin prenyltransferase UbiX n=1 Tax=Candidatus Lambdaproteobacteria bacterium RIFOXYD2_FULL_56_26 TaxID=1817773 RepID=A0A1F6GMT0_9PROT|nr:MAG: 3-octaprenyl-4-hydroxybenzoate carboxy-lyase [Candidatus Lambdaproteobacteria bacterium RIFOXYD2_FULL_56_26]OGH05578.1 MAG: 3-octaprenyl-4-hydroxybenzoate carboxy-lyase [Candidatus Lambdaproteobacteria bacterium RIFOXYC1_FULL_56_13]OGH08537.1 MAG: 3-octaprenyl-4-hydroxybenzoate carboxy-lyase [Candidatus Lambdaproteobacteria bacterium RIFOXYD1_FULL_56_27]
MDKQRLIVALSGASGALYGVRLLEVLAGMEQIETHLILTQAASLTLKTETGKTLDDLAPWVFAVHDDQNLASPLASGSFLTAGMVVLPCSIKSLSMIASSQNSNLLTRAADVTLKERRPLVLCPRETPLHLGHLRLMVQAAEQGAILAPPMPAFYHRPQTLDDLVDHMVGKVLDLLGIKHRLFARWGEP